MLASYLEGLLLGPGGAESPASLVVEDGAGHLAGFVGVVPRRMALGRAPLRVGVATQLMVAPGASGLVGRRLVRALMSAPFDLILADAANDAARRLWESAGGRTAVAYSLSWRRPLRPLRAFALRSGRSAAGRAAALATRPLCRAGDAVLARPGRWSVDRQPGDTAEPFDIAGDLASAADVFGEWVLHPSYDAETLRWILDEVSQKRGQHPRQIAVRDGRSRLVGWGVYTGRSGGTGDVVQVVARRGCHGRVLAWVFADAYARGLAELAGRLEPAAMVDLARAGATFTHEGPWMLVHSRWPEVMRAIDGGRALISRLDGEWWMRF